MELQLNFFAGCLMMQSVLEMYIYSYVINKQWIGKDMERRGHSLNEILYRHLPRGS
jgi:hypothetical protein